MSRASCPVCRATNRCAFLCPNCINRVFARDGGQTPIDQLRKHRNELLDSLDDKLLHRVIGRQRLRLICTLHACMQLISRVVCLQQSSTAHMCCIQHCSYASCHDTAMPGALVVCRRSLKVSRYADGSSCRS